MALRLNAEVPIKPQAGRIEKNPMHNPRFTPVPIALGRLGTTRLVTSAREAAECLLSKDWPAQRGEAARNARETLLAALEGNASGDEARAAFERAAQAAGILRGNLRGQ